MKLKRKKVGDRSYNLIDTQTGEEIANATQTGEHGRDNYPWTWLLLEDRIFGNLRAPNTKSMESLRGCVDWIESEAATSGVMKPQARISGYDVKSGQVFRYGGYFYTATGDARGEFNAYIPVTNYKDEPSEIIVRHGDSVITYE